MQFICNKSYAIVSQNLKADSYLHGARSTEHGARINFNSYFHVQLIMRAHDHIYCFQWES